MEGQNSPEKMTLEPKEQINGTPKPEVPEGNTPEIKNSNLAAAREIQEKEDQEKLEAIRKKINSEPDEDIMSKRGSLEDAEVIERILVEGTDEELEEFRLFHNLTQEQVSLYRQFERLRYETLKSDFGEFKERILSNPEPTEEEWEMGVYKENIESQVRDAVLTMRKKGYNTYESGFYGADKQRIGFEGEPLANVELADEAIEFAKGKGLTIVITPNSIELYYSRFIALNEIKEVWDKIAENLPDLGHKAERPSTGQSESFRKRVENFKKDPTPWLEAIEENFKK